MTNESSKPRIDTIIARLEYATVALSKTSSPDDAPPPAVSAEWYSQDVRFLLAELDAARAREQALAESFDDRVKWIQIVEARWLSAEAREAKLREAAQYYMSQFGQALEANDIPYGSDQVDADAALRTALEGENR